MREIIQRRQGPDICGERSPYAGGSLGTGTSCVQAHLGPGVEGAGPGPGLSYWKPLEV